MSENLEFLKYVNAKDSFHFLNMPSPMAKANYFYLQEIGHYESCYPFVSEHNHLDTYLILYTVSGRGLLTYHGMTYQLKPNQCFFIPCMEHHRYQAALHTKWDFYFLHFNGMNTESYYEQYRQDHFQILTLEHGYVFANIMQSIADLYQKRNPLSETLINFHITDLLTKLVIASSQHQMPRLAFPDYLKRVVNYIELHYREPLSLDDLASIENISKFHLSREFKYYIGVTPNEYIINMRLSHAKELLKYSTTPVGEIAALCGISNVSHFINLFKARESRTPLAYRKAWNSTAK
ncbi:MAG: AraC family transcriptional regulator [Lachnospiraceae bacterium]|nr:AraC family transcriptional regulator [Lachnospiraceae bacterium]